MAGPLSRATSGRLLRRIEEQLRSVFISPEAVRAGALTPNEAREQMGLPAVPDHARRRRAVIPDEVVAGAPEAPATFPVGNRLCIVVARRVEAQKPIEKSAEKRALQLLRRMLTPVQREGLDVRGSFSHQGKAGVFTLYCGSGQVTLETSKDVRHLCIHPAASAEALPQGDRTLAQLLHLRNDEERFLRTANTLGVYPLGSDFSPPVAGGALWRQQRRY